MDAPFNPATNEYTDSTGAKYTTPDNQPATSETTVTTHDTNGQASTGKVIGGNVTLDK